MIKNILSLVFFGVSASAFGVNYFCDPATGSMANSGTNGSPWSTLQAVFTANKTFQAGDTIFLRTGYHGFPDVKGNNSGYVVIMPQSGHSPTVKKMTVTNATRWIISGLTVSPEVVSSYEQGTFVDIRSSSSYITLKNCFIYSALDPTGWTQTDWETRMGNGINCSGPNCLITNNHVKNTDFSVCLSRPATNSVVSYNTVENVMGDGLRGLSDYGKFEYNLVKNFYVANANHDDVFQSWSGGVNGIPVGEDTVTGIEIRGNTFISHTDPSQPLLTEPQAIGCFDGMFMNWVVENNLIITEHWHGISLYGALNCKVVNNTLVENPLNFDATSMTPWIKITAHKNGTPATGNLVRNNFTCSMANDANVGTVDFNITSKNYAGHFVNYAGFDMHLKAGSAAINAGSNVNTPSIDLEKNTRTAPYDIGCYEYGGTSCGGPDVWVNTSFAQQTGSFTVQFDASPSADSIDGVVGLSNGTASAFTSLACIARFNTTGTIDARNGGAYQAANAITYTKGSVYHFRIVVNIPAKIYDIYVTPPGSSEQTVGLNYTFRTEQNTVTQLNNWAKNTISCSVAVTNFQVVTATGVYEANSDPVKIFPNPTAEAFAVSLNDFENAILEIYDPMGQKVIQEKLQNSNTIIDLKRFGAGVYQMRVVKGGLTVYIERIVKE